MQRVQDTDRFIVITDQIVLTPDTVYILRHGEFLTQEMGQHGQQHFRAASVIAVADQILFTGAVHTVRRICKQMDKVILSAPVIHVGIGCGVVLQIYHADGTFVLHHRCRIHRIAHPVKDIEPEFFLGCQIPGITVRTDKAALGQSLCCQCICQIVNDEGVGHIGEVNKVLPDLLMFCISQIFLTYMELDPVVAQQFQADHLRIHCVMMGGQNGSSRLSVYRRIQIIHINLVGIENDLTVVGINGT